MYTVYKHTSPSGKIYIGITSRKLKKRWEAGKGYKYNEHFFRAIQKYGWENIKHEVLFENLTKEEAEEKEIEMIALYNSTDASRGYNLRKGGSACSFSESSIEKMRTSHIGKTLPEEQKRKISKALKGRKTSTGTLGHKYSEETKAKMRASQIGKRLSEEAKKKISEAKKGRHTGKENHKSRRVRNIDTGEVFETISLASQKYGINHSDIVEVCRGRRKKSKGYRWEYAEKGGDINE